MIVWKDFILDDVLGTFLIEREERNSKDLKVCRRGRPGNQSIMEDAVSIQETGQEQLPARMVGFSSLDLTKPDMEVGSGDQSSRPGRET